MDELITILVSAAVGGASGWVGAPYRFRQERRARSGDDAAAEIRQAMTALGQLHSAGRSFQSACDQSGIDGLARAADEQVQVGRAYASGDQDTNAVQEEAAWRRTAELMRRLIREAQSP